MKPALILNDGNPLRIMRAAKAEATRAGWTLGQWHDLAVDAWDILAGEVPDGILPLLREHFDVTCGPKFSFDPKAWDHR